MAGYMAGAVVLDGLHDTVNLYWRHGYTRELAVYHIKTLGHYPAMMVFSSADFPVMDTTLVACAFGLDALQWKAQSRRIADS